MSYSSYLVFDGSNINVNVHIKFEIIPEPPRKERFFLNQKLIEYFYNVFLILLMLVNQKKGYKLLFKRIYNSQNIT